MKRILTTLFIASTFFAKANVIISQYYEGASFDKWIEITNVGESEVSLSGLYLCLFSNPGPEEPDDSPSANLALSGTIAVGASQLYQHNSANLPDYASGIITSSVCNFNGDDIVIISTSNDITAWANRIDVVGNGDNWGTNKSFYRNAAILSPNITFTFSEWTEVSNATVDNALEGTTERLGEHDFDAPLPISLTSFTARQLEAAKVSLDWTTASEENNDYFAIEYSTDGRHFDELGMVQGAGSTTTSQHYSYIHHHPLAGSNYYRLRQVDFDGTFSFSAIAVVELKSLGEVSLHPTLARHSIDISLGEAPANDAAVEVFNSYGQLVLAATFPAEADKLTLNVGDLETGHYFLRINRDGDMEVLRFMKI